MADEEQVKSGGQEAQDKPGAGEPESPVAGESEAAEAAPIEGEISSEEPVEEVKPEDAVRKIDTGMVVRVHVKIKDVTPKGDERERIQVFEGTVIAKKGRDARSATITVRKVSNGVGVERIFPLMMPAIDKIDIIKKFRVRRSKLYFLRGKFKKRMKEVPVEKE